MKFSELDHNGWAELQLYLDTCLLPVTGLTGLESPPEATDKAAKAGEWLSPLESAFRGRTVTLPAYHYYDAEDEEERRKLERYCERVKSTGFRYLAIVSGESGWNGADYPSADLIVAPANEGEAPDPEAIRAAVTSLWKKEIK